MLTAEKNSPGDTAGILALQEERLGFAVLETEDLAVATDEELTLQRVSENVSITFRHVCNSPSILHICQDRPVISCPIV